MTQAEQQGLLDTLQGKKNDLEDQLRDKEKELSRADDIAADLAHEVESLNNDINTVEHEMAKIENADIEEPETSEEDSE